MTPRTSLSPLFDPDASILTLVLDTPSAAHDIGITVLPQAIIPTPGHTLDDAILMLLSSRVFYGVWDGDRKKSWAWASLPNTPGGFAHPYAHFAPGCLHTWPAFPELPTPSTPIRLQLCPETGQMLVDGTPGAAPFLHGSAYNPQAESWAVDFLEKERDKDDALCALIFGVAQAAMKRPDIVNACIAIAGHTVLSHADDASVSLDRVTTRILRARRIISALIDGWILRQSTPTRHAGFLPGALWESLVSPYTDHPHFRAGQAAGALIETTPWSVSQHIGIKPIDTLSAHVKVRLHINRKAVRDLLRHLDTPARTPSPQDHP